MFVVSFASGCGLTPKVIDTYCENTFVIEPTGRDVDVVSDRLARQIVVHNSRRERVCQ
jgi:hypothetical protein